MAEKITKSINYVNDLIDKKRDQYLKKIKELIFNIENVEFDGNKLYKEILINSILELEDEINNLDKMAIILSAYSDRLYIEKDENNHYVVREKEY